MTEQERMRRLHSQRRSLMVRLDEMDEKIHRPTFRRPDGKANEVNYWVFDYEPEKELEVRDRIKAIKTKNDKGHENFTLVVYDLYDIIIEYLESKRFIEKTEKMEEKHGFGRVVKAVQRSLKISDKNNYIVNYMVEHTPENAVVFITGIGRCYPLLEAPEVFNKILYNMPNKFISTPMILFYPGTYTEQELVVFDEHKEGNYYRAFRIAR